MTQKNKQVLETKEFLAAHSFEEYDEYFKRYVVKSQNISERQGILFFCDGKNFCFLIEHFADTHKLIKGKAENIKVALKSALNANMIFLKNKEIFLNNKIRQLEKEREIINQKIKDLIEFKDKEQI